MSIAGTQKRGATHLRSRRYRIAKNSVRRPNKVVQRHEEAADALGSSVQAVQIAREPYGALDAKRK